MKKNRYLAISSILIAAISALLTCGAICFCINHNILGVTLVGCVFILTMWLYTCMFQYSLARHSQSTTSNQGKGQIHPRREEGIKVILLMFIPILSTIICGYFAMSYRVKLVAIPMFGSAVVFMLLTHAHIVGILLSRRVTEGFR